MWQIGLIPHFTVMLKMAYILQIGGNGIEFVEAGE